MVYFKENYNFTTFRGRGAGPTYSRGGGGGGILQTHPKQIWAGLAFTSFAWKLLSQHTGKTSGRGPLYIMTFRSPQHYPQPT